MSTMPAAPLRIGVIGYSRPEFDRTIARQKLETSLQFLIDMFHPSSVEVVSGLTAIGIPLIAYEIAKARSN